MGATLILGRDEDLCCRLVRQELAQAGREVVFLPEDKLLPHLSLGWTPDDGEGFVRFGEDTVRFPEMDGVLYRFYGLPVSADDYATPDGQYLCSEWNALFMAWLDQRPCPAANRLQPPLWYKTRLGGPELRALAPDLPFRLPRTLVTTDGEAARVWCHDLGGPAVYTPLTGATPYPLADEAALDKLVALSGKVPLHLTEVLPGRACDAYVVGETVTLVGGGPDGADLGPAPDALAARCARVGTGLGLAFFQLSLVESAEGEWACLSLDRMPHLYGCGPDAQRQIARRLAAFLCGEGSRA